jgi:hypothetical protein
MPVYLALFYMQTERKCQLSSSNPRGTTPKTLPQTILASGKYAAKRTIAVAGNQDFFMT